MKKYLVSIPYFCTYLLKVEAESAEAAKELALSQGHPSLCCYCSDTLEMDEMNDEAEITVEEI